jgi:hypothetical protein
MRLAVRFLVGLGFNFLEALGIKLIFNHLGFGYHLNFWQCFGIIWIVIFLFHSRGINDKQKI